MANKNRSFSGVSLREFPCALNNAKRLVLLQLLLVASAALHAQPTRILLWLASGEQVAYNLSDRPKVVRDGGDVHLVTNTAEIVYAAGEVRKITFDDETSGIGRAADGQTSGQAIFAEGQMTLTGFRPGEPVRVFDAAGRLSSSHVVGSDGSLTVGLGALGKGVHIVKTQRQTFKFVKK